VGQDTVRSRDGVSHGCAALRSIQLDARVRDVPDDHPGNVAHQPRTEKQPEDVEVEITIQRQRLNELGLGLRSCKRRHTPVSACETGGDVPVSMQVRCVRTTLKPGEAPRVGFTMPTHSRERASAREPSCSVCHRGPPALCQNHTKASVTHPV
jgi:hypothetical protein